MRNLKAKKSLGQNFLKSEAALRKIIEVGELSSSDTVLEIGPGKGALTERLLNHAGKVIAVEKDRELVSFLKEKFGNELRSGKFILVEGDILDFDIESNKLGSYKLIANIPYNITGAILKKFLTAKFQPERLVLLVQQEVAQRIVARPTTSKATQGRESILSISVKAYGTPKLEMKVPARYFSPAPKVDSAIISIKNISREFFIKNDVAEEVFWEIVKKSFAHKRKKLTSNLKETGFVLTKETIDNFGNKRAEELSLEEWKNLVKTSLQSKKVV